jgi:predicted DsbA family dithiol-disulfide isomerase
VEVEWQPYELHPELPPEGRPREQRGARGPNRVQLMAQEAGLEMNTPTVTPNPHRAFEAAEYAKTQGKGSEFHRAVFDAYWRRGLNIGTREVLLQVADEVGLPREPLDKALTEGAYRDLVDQKLDAVRQLGVTAVPTFIFNGRYAVEGAYPYELFRRVVTERLLKENEGS